MKVETIIYVIKVMSFWIRYPMTATKIEYKVVFKLVNDKSTRGAITNNGTLKFESIDVSMYFTNTIDRPSKKPDVADTRCFET